MDARGGAVPSSPCASIARKGWLAPMTLASSTYEATSPKIACTQKNGSLVPAARRRNSTCERSAGACQSVKRMRMSSRRRLLGERRPIRASSADQRRGSGLLLIRFAFELREQQHRALFGHGLELLDELLHPLEIRRLQQLQRELVGELADRRKL